MYMILNEICELKGWHMEDIPLEQQERLVFRYLDAILEDGTWCGSEMIAAVIKLYNVDIIVYTEDSDPWEFTVPEASRKINLFFSGQLQKNHYDVVIKIENCQNDNHADIGYAIYNTHSSVSVCDRVDIRPSVGESFFTAIMKGLLGMHLHGWQLDINALNLRRSAINELSRNSSFYMNNVKSFEGISHEQYMDLLTHWNEAGNSVDIDIGEAIAEVLQSNIVISTSYGDNITYAPRSNSVRCTVVIQEEQNGTFVATEENLLLETPVNNENYTEDLISDDPQEITDEPYR